MRKLRGDEPNCVNCSHFEASVIETINEGFCEIGQAWVLKSDSCDGFKLQGLTDPWLFNDVPK